MAVITIGMDLAKNVFSLHGADDSGKVALQRTVRRHQYLNLVTGCDRSPNAIEGVSSATSRLTPGLHASTAQGSKLCPGCSEILEKRLRTSLSDHVRT